MKASNTTGTSASSNDSFLPIKKRVGRHHLIDATNKLHLNDATNYVRVVRTPKRRTGTALKNKGLAKKQTVLKNKGLLPQPNGHCGAQIYRDHVRYWLGTFRSVDEAARAYYSASIKLGKSDANFPPNVASDDLEREFQNSYTQDDVLSMIKDGSYPHKLKEYLNNRSHTVKSIDTKKKPEESEVYTLLFQKELTPSDVGKLNRLVIPKKYAVRYLPHINVDQSEKEEGEIERDVEEVEVVFYDKAMKQWKFRYCYWLSSQSYVFTRGWINFVKEKKLKEKDVILFYTCESCDVDGQSKNLLMIDVHHYSENSSVVPDEVNKTVHKSSDSIEMETNVVSSNLKDDLTKLNENKGGIWLFGTWIQAKPNQS